MTMAVEESAAEPDQHRGGCRIAEERRGKADRDRAGEHLQPAEAEHEAAHGEQALQRQLEPDQEQEEDDAELRHAGDLPLVADGDPAERGPAAAAPPPLGPSSAAAR